MLAQNILVWNAHGLNSRARRDVVCEFVAQQQATVVCLVETKLPVISASMANDLMPMALDYVCLPSVGASSGIVVAWRSDAWLALGRECRVFSVMLSLQSSLAESLAWTLVVVYGPVHVDLKQDFLAELRDITACHTGPLLVCGDFFSRSRLHAFFIKKKSRKKYAVTSILFSRPRTKTMTG
jgi:exonuclease III